MHIIESMRRIAADIEAKPTLNLSTALESESERVEAESGGYAAGNVYGWIAFAIATQLAPDRIGRERGPSGCRRRRSNRMAV